MSIETLLIILLIGAIAGWLAGVIVRGSGFGLLPDIVIGIVGAFIGAWLLPRLGVRVGSGLVASIVVATIGAIVLLALVSLFARSSGRGAGRFRLTPPTMPVFVISVILAIVALLAHYAGVRIPNVSAARAFDLLAIGYVLLLAGVMFVGL